jgi:hypothetical protein
MTEDPGLDAVHQLIEAFTGRAREELEHRLKAWPLDLAKRDFHEVVGALLARQVTLASQLAACPPIWNGHIAPLILRAMADAYITLAWLLKDPLDRCKKFIHYGLGQEKLQLEHRRAEMETRQPHEGEREYCEAIEAWTNSQRATFLTDVNVGSWSGMSTRAMAEEAGCLDFYNYVYTPFSACSHSMWQHVARYNLKECRSPLHRFHGVPAVRDAPLDTDYLYLAAKYLQKTFAAFDGAVGITTEIQSAFDVLCQELDRLGASDSASQREESP